MMTTALSILLILGTTLYAADGHQERRLAQGGCATVADCADLDGDFIRDDNCQFWECIAGSCVGTQTVFGDMSGALVSCPINGVTDGNDAFMALGCFTGVSTCEDTPPNAYNVDAGGRFGSCVADGACDLHDYYHAINTFFGTSTCACSGPAPSTPQRGATGGSGARVFMAEDGQQGFVASSGSTTLFMDPGSVRTVMVWLDDTIAGDTLAAYQLMWPSSATPLSGASGSIDYIDGNPGGGGGDSMTIDTARADWVFADSIAITPANHSESPWVNAVGLNYRAAIEDDTTDPGGGPIRYLAQFDIAASPDACGSFELSLVRTPQTPPVPFADMFALAGAEYGVDEYQTLIIHIGPQNDDCADAEFLSGPVASYDTTCGTADGPQDCGNGSDVWFRVAAGPALKLEVFATVGDVAVYGPYTDTVPCPPDTAAQCDPGLILPSDETDQYLIQIIGDDITGSLEVIGLCGCLSDADCDDNDLCTLNTCADCTCTSTTIIDGCADGDNDDIRDDNCVWYDCSAGQCLGTDIVFADMGGQFGDCAPDGAADGNDRFHALNCFANVDADQTPGYSCERNPPAAFNVDAGGAFGSCSSDGVCDGNDAFHALNAFAGTSTCSCPLDGQPAPTRSRTAGRR